MEWQILLRNARTSNELLSYGNSIEQVVGIVDFWIEEMGDVDGYLNWEKTRLLTWCARKNKTNIDEENE